MPTPPLDYKTVTGQYVAPDGSVVAGTLRFIPSETVYDLAGNVIVPASPILVVLDGTGAFSVDLAVTDSTDTSPTGWLWQVSELIPNGKEATFSVPGASAASVPLTTLMATVTTAVPSFSYASTGALAALDGRVTSLEATAAIVNAGAVLLHPFLYMGA
jgi:hypothetical protein